MSDKKQPGRRKRWSELKSVPMNGGAVILTCLLSAGISGLSALKATNPDQGKTFTVAEAKAGQERFWERLRNNPHIPERVKSAALKYNRFKGRDRVSPSPSPTPDAVSR